MEAWQVIGLSGPVIRGLYDCGFKKPTPVQMQAIPVTMKTEGDVIGAAETVSFKFPPLFFFKLLTGSESSVYLDRINLFISIRSKNTITTEWNLNQLVTI